MANSIRNNVIFVDTTGLVLTGSARVIAVAVKAAAVASSVVLQDALTATGQEMANVGDVAPTGFDGIVVKADFRTGIFATLAGAGAKAYIYLE